MKNCQTDEYVVLFPRQAAGYEFPEQSLECLDGYGANQDEIQFGLIPLEE